MVGPRLSIVEDRGLLTICFFGMLASGFDFEPVMMGLRRMGNRAPEIRLIICGEGPNLRDIQRSAYGLDGVYFAGHVSGAHIKTMMDRSDVALALMLAHATSCPTYRARSANISQPDYRC